MFSCRFRAFVIFLSLAPAVFLGGCETIDRMQFWKKSSRSSEIEVRNAQGYPDNATLDDVLASPEVQGYGQPKTDTHTDNAAGVPSAKDPRVILYPLEQGADNGAYNDVEKDPFAVPVAVSKPAQSSYVPSSVLNAAPPTKVNTRIPLPPLVGNDISQIYFAYGSARLDNASKNAMASISEKAKFSPMERVQVEGYASPAAQTKDVVQAKILNLKESMDRAQVVTESLLRHGVPAEKIKTVAWGDTKASSESEQESRRVDIITGQAGY
jgi:outer membrane protein OmpA-like peptidoglycan-associated protein